MAMWLLLLRSQLGPLRISWMRMMLTDDYKMSVTQRNTHLTITQQGRLFLLIGESKTPFILPFPLLCFPSFSISLPFPFPSLFTPSRPFRFCCGYGSELEGLQQVYTYTFTYTFIVIWQP